MIVNCDYSIRILPEREAGTIPTCNICAKEIIPPFIFWMSDRDGGDILLHPDCALNLVIGLSRDISEYKTRFNADIKLEQRKR
jgi:hypothetical protein